MYGILLLAVCSVAVLAKPEGIPRCGRIMHGEGLECCKKDRIKLHHAIPPPDDIKECLSVPRKPPPSCEMEICIAKKRGYASDDGTIDTDKLQNFVEDKLKDNAELASAVTNNCIKGDRYKYGPEDMCDFMKFKLCYDVQIIKSCDEWNDEGDCNGMQDLAEECISVFQ